MKKIWKKSYTERGLDWECQNTKWFFISLLSLGVLSGPVFLYLGIKVKNNLWKLWGILYFAIFLLIGETSSNIIDNYLMMLVICSILHLLMIRPKYLIYLDVLQKVEIDKYSNFRSLAQAKFNGMETPSDSKLKDKFNSTRGSAQSQTEPPKPLASQTDLVDLNLASESVILTLPRINLILAKRIVQKREELNGFTSFEHFISEVNLTENIADAIKNQVVFSKIEKPVVAGRMIDF